MADEYSLPIGLDLTDWKTGVTQLNRDVREINSEFKAVASGMDDWKTSAEGLAARNDALNGIIEKQQGKVAVLVAEQKRMREEAEKNNDTSDGTKRALQELSIKINKAKEDLGKSETELRKNSKAMEELGGESEDAEQGLEDLGQAVEDVEKESGNLGATLGAVGRGIGGAFVTAAKAAAVAVAAVGAALTAAAVKGYDMAKSAAAMADNYLTLSAQTGISTDDLQKYAYAADLIDVPLETMTGSMAKMVKQMGAAQGGSKTAQKAFKALGVDIKDSNGQLRDSEDVYADAITALGKMSNETERDALAMEIFGKSAQDLNSMIALTTPELGAVEKAMNATGREGKASKAMFDNLGVAVTDSNGNLRDSKQVYSDAYAAIAALEDPLEQDKAAMQLFGTEFANVTPEATTFKDTMNELGEEAVAMGTVFSGEALAAMGSFDDSVQKLSSTSEAAKNAIGLTLMPMFQPLVDTATQSMASVSKAFQSGLTPESLETLATELTTSLTEAVGQISTIFETAVPLVTLGLTTLINALIEALPGMMETLLPAAMGLLQSVIDGITENIEPLTALALSLITMLAGFLIENIPTLAASAIDLMLGLVDGIIAALPELIPAAVEMMVKLAVALVEAIPEIVARLPEICAAIFEGLKNIDWLQLGTDMLNGLVNGLSTAVTTVIEAIKGVFSSILQAIKDLFGIASPSTEMAGVGGFLLDGLVAGIGGAIDAAVEAVKKFFGKIWDAIKSIFGFGAESEESKQAKEAGAEITKGVTQGVTGETDGAETAVETLGNKLLAKLRSTLGIENGEPYSKGYGSAVVKGLLSGMDEKATEDNVSGSAAKVSTAIDKALAKELSIKDGVAGKFKAVGEAIAEGIKAGVEAGAKSIAEAAKTAASSALSAAKEELDIKSPSRRAREEVGMQFGLGVAEGLADSTRAINAAMTGVTGKLASDAAGQAQAARQGVGSGTTTITKHEELHIHAPNQLSPAEVARQYRNAKRQIELGIGGAPA